MYIYLLVLGQLAQPSFSALDALDAEWRRAPPSLSAAALLPKDRARLSLTLARIGAPGAPSLAPPDEGIPAWEAAARRARTPAERYEALFMLNRKKAAHPLVALLGLTVADAKSWPRHLHLDGQIAAARLLGDTVGKEMEGFLAALPRDPVRAQAARLRLVLSGQEEHLLPPIAPTPGAVLAVLGAWNQGPFPRRQTEHLALLQSALAGRGGPLSTLGLAAPSPAQMAALRNGLLVRLIEGLPDPAPPAAFPVVLRCLNKGESLLVRLSALLALGRFAPALAAQAARKQAAERDVRLLVALLPSLRKLDGAAADRLRDRLLLGDDAIARGVAIDDLPTTPTNLRPLLARLAADRDVDGLSALIRALVRWRVPPAQGQAILLPFLHQGTWIHRYEAWQALRGLSVQVPFPAAPPPTALERQILAEAKRLLLDGGPVRLRLDLEGERQLVLRLDPTIAPQNVASLALLARRGYFDGLTFHRVVPDFVVQGGDPRGTGDGGPGYALRCEDSLVPFAPGSVGMALSGKDTGGSQFFLTTNATPHLRGRYTHLGVVEDLDRSLPLLDDLALGARINRAVILPEGGAKGQRSP